ncbi:Uncharacterised protein [Salmonella enterica subsp. enterica serovar Bovismorbificans]|uniref:Uncharacterized protein n=1 Tax=Salmonella enterica subsp. enterica serovar Bovismorbificans TaxID=58097 RepID=A0A655DRR1_SALET|nr:Uncharacterised protein [Salmonella enterica subsp. enterica serovar Bovismorbificans]
MQQLFHTGMEPRFDLYVGQIVSQRRAFNHADIHAATFDRRFSAFNAFRIGGD